MDGYKRKLTVKRRKQMYLLLGYVIIIAGRLIDNYIARKRNVDQQ